MLSTNAQSDGARRRNRNATGVTSRRRARAAAAQTRRNRLVAFVLAPVLTLGTVGLGVWGASAASAAPVPPPTAAIGLQQTGGAYGDADDKPFILAGEDATFDVSLTNTSATGGYNIGFTVALPNGIDFVSSGGMGSPVVYPSGATLPNSSKTPPTPLATVPAGQQLWVFEDVSDLPATATYASTLTVRPDAAVFPVGASPDLALAGYISSAPSLKPVFDGSTGVGGAAALAETSSGADASEAPVHALRLTKTEPSPEIELLRGVHQNQTVYTLTVESTPQGTTDGVTIVDYIPAGLEFLACASDDNTAASPLLYNGSGSAGGSLEYPGSGDVTGIDPGDCIAPVSVETVNTGIPANLPAGVYTRVEWQLPSLSGTTPQAFPAAAGVPAVHTIRYAAAVPLFENTMDFVTASGAPAPSPASLNQGSNLNNNNGASTRQGQPDGFNDGVLYKNSATVAGTYTGPVSAEPAHAASDTDTEEIQAMDLRVLKGVDTGSGPDGNDFVTGGLATFSLDVATSEYTSADEIELVDTLPNGLCPVLPGGGAAITGDPLPADCAYPSGTPGATLSGAVVTGIDYDDATGETKISFVLDEPTTIDAEGNRDIAYTALMRAVYDTDAPYSGPTSSGDALTNYVEIRGITHSIPAVASVTNGAGVPAAGDEDVWDDSSAEIVSDYSQIQKQVLPRAAVIDTAPDAPTAAESCDVAPGAPWQQNQDAAGDAPFHLGDVVCYELTVDYAEQIDVRNPVVTDFLPAGVEYVDWAVGDATNGIAAADIVPQGTFGARLQWQIGTVDADGDRIVQLGSTLVLHVLGRITSMTPNNSPVLDKPQNLMKYQQENVLGDVYFLRDASAIQTGQGPSLLKGVEDVDGDATLPARSQNDANGTVFDSNRDGIRVVQGDVATFRVDLTGGDTAVQDLVVWDALPAGITKADVSAVSDGGTALDPGDAGYPSSLDPTYAGRSVIVWTGISLAAAEELTRTYDVTVPAGAQVDVDYVNTASITQYDALLNTGATETFFPTDSLDDTSRPIESNVPGVGMRDDSDVYLPPAVVTKDLVSTEISPATANLDPNNGAGQAVAGELITYRYSVAVPGNTTVANGVLRDRGPLTPGNRTFVPVSGSVVGGTPSGFTFTLQPAAGSPDAGTFGSLRFPASYTNSTSSAQTFTVELTGYIQRGQTIANNATLTNTAAFDSDSWDGTDTATVQYVSPNPQLTKTGTPENDVAAGQDVDYVITVANGGNRPKSYDNVIVDTVPVGLIVDASTISGGGVLAGAGPNGGGTVTWTVEEIPATATLTYTAQIDPTVGSGEQYVNTAALTGYTLPDALPGDPEGRRGELTDSDSHTIVAIDPGIAKGVRTAGSTGAFTDLASEPIGESVEYQVVVTLPPNVNFYAPTIVDDLPAGAELQTASIVGPTPSDPAISGTWTRTIDAPTNRVTWAYDGNIVSSTSPRTLSLTYDVLLSNAVAPNVNDLDNTADFTWLPIPGGTRDSVSDDADVDVLNPVLAIDKQVSNATPNPGAVFDYTLRVTNTGDTPAYNSVISDVVPDGVLVDAASISDGGVLTGATATGGGTITWDSATAGGDDLDGPLYQAGGGSPTELVLTYSAKLAASSTLDDDETFTNVASVEEYTSFGIGGRTYEPTDVDDEATVDPPFPNVELTKTATAGDIAYADTPFGWTLRLQNSGNGPAQTVAVTDVLPKNWTYDAGSARIAFGAGATAVLANPTVTTAAGVQTLVWSAADITSTSPALAAGAGAVITFTATPTTAALTDAGVTAPNGTRVAHVNTLSATTTDTSGATSNGSGAYTGPNDTADAFLLSADIELEKNAAATPLVAGGAAGTAWTISVSNNGPDTATGPFTVADLWGDAGELPAGFTVTGFAGTGWSCLPTTDEGFSCERTNAADTLASGASFPEIVVTAQAAASMDPAQAPVENTASVTAKTFDPDEDNNEDGDEVPVTFAADLAMLKTGPATAPNAGAPLTWTLTATNNGAADSRSVTGDLITVTDVIPEGVENVTVGTLPAGWTSDASGPLQPGDTVTFTLAAGSSIPATQSVAFTLTGTVDPSLAPGTAIVNAATVNPGATDDPDPENNTDDTTVTPTTDTAIDVTKVRVVEVNGEWVPAAGLTPVPAVVPGDPVTYLVTVANTGTADARTVTVADEVEPYLTYSSFTSVGGVWTRTSTAGGPGDDQAFALTGNLAPATTASFRVTFLLDPAHTGEVENTVLADAANADEEDASDDSGSQRSADLSVVKTHTGEVTAGRSLPYTITVTNEGPSDSSGPITIGDVLPAGFSFAEGTATVSIAGAAPTALAPVVDGQALTWTVGSGASFVLADAAQIVIVFTANVDAAVLPSTYVNVATVDGPDDTDPLNNRDDDPTVVNTSADLSIVKTAAAGPHIAGTSVTYTLAVTNAGPSVARTVSVTDVIPAGLTVTAISGAGWTCDVATAACGRDDLAVGSSSITVTAAIASTVPDGTELENTATVGSTTSDPTPGNNTDTEEITVDAEADLAVVKTAIDEAGEEITTVVAGTDVRYLLEVQNNGPSAAVGPIEIADTLPAGFTFVSVAEGADAWSCETDAVDPQLLECVTPAGLAAGASLSDLVVVVAVDPALGAGETTNVATVSSPTLDPIPGNNTDDAVVDVTQEVDLSIVKSHDASEVHIGEELVFDLAVVNDGPSDATNVTVTDTLPAGLEYNGAAASDEAWTVVAGEVAPDGTTAITATLAGPLAVGATAPTLQIATLLQAGAYPTVTNVAVVAADQPDTDPTDNTSDDEVSVPALASLRIVKTALGSFQAGSDARYTIEVSNDGPTEDPGPVVITDVLPNSMRFVSASGDGVSCVGGQTVSCELTGPLAAGASVTVTLVVALQQGAFPEVVNTATVASPTEQLPTAVLSWTATTPVTADPLAATGAEAGSLLIAAAGALLLALLGVLLMIWVRRRRIA